MKQWRALDQVPSRTASGTAPVKAGTMHSCGCVGPQNGEPFCPCKMRGVQVKNGRYVLPEQDLGPVRTLPPRPADDFGYDWLS